ncbi:MAG TPA: helix-turn-helix domain-containing protein, partial [Rhodocyclaceae bacterium]|nr:helix-turn-helix domain-containing protein [Rhodocyclaceae bacterium]
PQTLTRSEATRPLAARPAAVTAPVPAGRLDDVQRQAIQAAVANARGNLSLAARTLGISRSTLYVKLASMRPADETSVR